MPVSLPVSPPVILPVSPPVILPVRLPVILYRGVLLIRARDCVYGLGRRPTRRLLARAPACPWP
jgi:hypothetical protein